MAIELDAVVVTPPDSPVSSALRPSYAWEVANEADERRQCFRRSLHCGMLLMEGEGTEDARDVIPGECLNVSDWGLYGTVPLGYGVALGQSYTFRLMVDERGPEPDATQIIVQRGVIIRTELLMNWDGGGDRVGIAVKLIGHRRGVIPMPSWS